MALNDLAARVGITGGVVTAPVGTAAGADLLGAWPAGWLDLGYLGDGGLTESRNEDRQEWTPWQSDTPIRTQVTSATKTFQFTCWESNGPVVALYYQVTTAQMGTTGTIAPNIGVTSFNDMGRPAPMRRAFGFDVIDGTNMRRFHVPSGECTARGDIVYVTSDIIKYDLTVTAYAGSDGIAVKRHFREGWTIPTGFVST